MKNIIRYIDLKNVSPEVFSTMWEVDFIIDIQVPTIFQYTSDRVLCHLWEPPRVYTNISSLLLFYLFLRKEEILITNQKNIVRLYEVLILNEVLKLNNTLDLSINEFKRGLEIQFPAREIIADNSFVIDEKIADFLTDDHFVNLRNKKIFSVIKQLLDKNILGITDFFRLKKFIQETIGQ